MFALRMVVTASAFLPIPNAEPVGSRNIARLLPMTLSPATVRNVMTDLELAGLIYAPHTSAGRLPTERGLRFFVDAMMEVGNLTSDERSRIEAQIRAAASHRTLDATLTEASTLLSGLSRGAGVVVTTKANARLKHIEFVRLDPARALVVLVADDGTVENRLLSLPPGLPASALTEAANFLNARIMGKTLGDLRQEIAQYRSEMERELDALTARLVESGIATSSGPSSDRHLIVRGQANLLEDLKAQDDLERIRLLFGDLETQTDVIELLTPGGGGRWRAHLHRLREQAVLDVGLVDGRGAVPRCRAAHRRGGRHHRADTAELCPHRADGGLHREGGGAAAGWRPLIWALAACVVCIADTYQRRRQP